MHGRRVGGQAGGLMVLLVVAAATAPAALAVPAARDAATRPTPALETGTVSVRIKRTSATRRSLAVSLVVTVRRGTRGSFGYASCAAGSQGRCATTRRSDVFRLVRGRNRIQRNLLLRTRRPCARVTVREHRSGSLVALIRNRDRALRVCVA